MIAFWTRLRFASARDLGFAALIALVVAVVLDAMAPHGAADAFFVAALFGMGLGLGIFALGAYWRRRDMGR